MRGGAGRVGEVERSGGLGSMGGAISFFGGKREKETDDRVKKPGALTLIDKVEHDGGGKAVDRSLSVAKTKWIGRSARVKGKDLPCR